MSIKSDQTFELIKSLSNSEVNYFKKYALFQSKKAQPEYITLFDALLKMKKYDEKKLNNNNLSYNKNYLFNLIIDSLKNSLKFDDIETNINNLINESKILSNKGLVKLALKKLRKAKEISIKEEKCMLIFEILKQEKLLAKFKNKREKQEFLDENFKNSKRALNAEQEILNYNELGNQIANLHYDFVSNKKIEVKNIVEELLNSNELLNKTENLSSRVFFYKNHLISHCYSLLGQNEKSLEFEKEMFLDRLAHKSYHKSPNLFIASLTSILSFILDLKKHNEFNDFAKYFNLITVKNQNDEIKLFERETVFFLRYYIESNQTKKGIRYLKETLENFLSFQGKMAHRRKAEIIFGYALLHLKNKDYKQSSVYFDSLEQDSSNSLFMDFIIVSKILNSFCHLELNNNLYLDSYLKKLSAFFTSNKINTGFEDFILKNLTKMNKDSDKSLNNYYSQMHTKMLTIQNETVKVQKYFDFENWFLMMSK